jgi:Fe-S cluster assembly ATPase SufC
MITIKDLKANIDDKEILKGINLTINPGEVHAIMGPNGSGKSTLASVLAGRDHFDVTGGTVEFNGKDLLEMSLANEQLPRASPRIISFQHVLDYLTLQACRWGPGLWKSNT